MTKADDRAAALQRRAHQLKVMLTDFRRAAAAQQAQPDAARRGRGGWASSLLGARSASLHARALTRQAEHDARTEEADR